MNLLALITTTVLIIASTSIATNSTSPDLINTNNTTNNNKTKRTVAPQINTYGANRSPPPPLIYLDNSPSQTALTGFYSPVTIKPVFDPEIPKQVAAQQVLYEFQETPTNAVSNVHVNQFYQPIGNNHGKEQLYPATNHNNQNSDVAETIAAPVQHSALIRHGQNLAQVQFQPHHIQNQQYVPGKYLYVNGKILYQPQHNLNQQQQQHQQYPLYNNNINNINNQRPLHNIYQQNQPQRFSPPATIYGFKPINPAVRQPYQPITKPVIPAPVELNDEKNEDHEEVKEHEDIEAEDDDKESYEEADSEDDDDDTSYFGKYSFEDDDDDDGDHERYREEDDEDSERESSRHVPKKQKKVKKPQKYSKSNNYKFSENFSTSSKYDSDNKAKKKSSTKKPTNKAQYKSMKYTKNSKSGKPRDRYEGKQSENIPVVHKHKLFKEKWYVTKSTDE